MLLRVWENRIVFALPMNLLCTSLVSCSIFFAISGSCWAQDESEKVKFTDQQLEFFESKVRPLLVEKCFECHGPDSKPLEGGLAVASRKAMLEGGDTGPAMVPGHAAKSLLIDAVNYGDVYEMPPDTKMSAEEIAVLTKWVDDGAAWPDEEEVVVDTEKFDLAARKSEHWVWQPIKRPNPPEVKDSSWPSDPIDSFVLAKLEEAKLAPAEPANRLSLIRRAYFDLIGMPPTREQIQDFLDDESDEAFEKVIDGLLQSPHYGERWARHWMDLTRYAESGGHEFDYEIRHAYQYRDYLIRAFNEDVSYKQFVHEHIAGDLLETPRRHPVEQYHESILGTGFWFLGEAKHAPVDAKEEEARTIDNQIDVMCKTFLGLTVACARCHDHKFDAISTEDYYAMSGFLQSSRRQEAMLDPGRKIESSFNKVSKIANRADALTTQLLRKLDKAEPQRLAEYLDGAIEVLRADQSWDNSNQVFLEGETLKEKTVSAGRVLVQQSRRLKLNWRGQKQRLWKRAKVGDIWELEFDAPKESKVKRFVVSGLFTNAADYGIFRISINDKVAIERIDFYAEKPQLGELIEIADVELKSEGNVVRFECLGKHDSADPGQLVGLDYLRLVPIDDSSSALNDVLVSEKLDVAILGNLVESIKNDSTKSNSHPLNLLRWVCSNDVSIDEALAKRFENEVAGQQARVKAWESESELFANFDNGLPPGWYKTGYAFGDDVPEGLPTAASGAMFQSPSTVSSGRFGKQFYGVLRSPTFKLDSDRIFYRYRGEKFTIRLIIDGYVMDDFSTLLFRGCKVNPRPSEAFVWKMQTGDLKNHLGSRAHIEIIDHGSGYFELDEIRMSKKGHPIDVECQIKSSVAKSGFDSRESFCNAFAEGLVTSLKQCATDPDGAAVLSWIVENDLTESLLKDHDEVSSSETQKETWEPNDGAGPLGSPDVLVSSVLPGRPATGSALSASIRSRREEIRKLASATPAPRLAIAMTDGTGEEEFVFVRGNHKALGKQATRRFLSAISARPLNPADGSGRLLLAQKMTASNNPLTSRVAVNRIWHHLFGRGIVGSVDNFGVLGKEPTHPELLDYLSSQFMADGWSLKRMIKRVMMTSAYQMASTANPAAVSIDPDNLLLHRGNIRRLQGEAIRDSILAISGRLDRKMYGPSVPVYLTSFMSGRGRPLVSGPVDGQGRRSVYISIKRNFLSPMMLAFDTPIPFNAIGRRNVSNVPAQALILMNDPFVIEQAKTWSQKLVAQKGTTRDRVETIYWAAIGRAPTESEIDNAVEFVELQAKESKIPPERIEANVGLWQDVCHVIFNLKEFIYIK